MTNFHKPIFIIKVEPLGEINVPVCTKADWEFLCLALSLKSTDRLCTAATRICGIIPQSMPISVYADFLSAYKSAVEDYCKENTDIFTVPYRPDFEYSGEEPKLHCITYGERLVHEHSGLSFSEIDMLDILDYKMFLADAVKLRILCRADGKGIEYLNECYDYMHNVSTMFG